MKKRYIFCSILFLFGVLFSSVSIVNAQMSGVKISPVKIEEIVEPGEVIKRQIKIKNQSNEFKTFFIYLQDFKAQGESGKPKFFSPDDRDQGSQYLIDWIEITDEAVDFKPREEKLIDYYVVVPEDAGPGGYYGAILFGNQPPTSKINSEDRGAMMTTGQKVGSLVLLRVKGEVYEEARIQEFTTDKGVYGTPFDVNFQVKINNLGNIHIKPFGTISIKNMFGKEVKSVVFNDGGANILPNSRRIFDENWEAKIGFGKYTAELGMVYGTTPQEGGSGKQSLYSEREFWIIPWKIVLPTLGVFLVLLVIFMSIIRLYKNKAVRKAMKRAGLDPIILGKKKKGNSPAAHLGLIMFMVFIVFFLLIVILYFLFFA